MMGAVSRVAGDRLRSMVIMKMTRIDATDRDRVALVGWPLGIVLMVLGVVPCPAADDEAFIVTPPGFSRPGEARTATGAGTARLRLNIRDRATGRPTPCRLNVVGPDGDFYQPAANPLSPYSLTGQWPKTGKGNREGKAPIRYFGRFFYTTGEIEVAVPAGPVRVEVWKGFEYRPVREGRHGGRRPDDLGGSRSRSHARDGDARLPIGRLAPALRPQDRGRRPRHPRPARGRGHRFGSILAYNEPAGPYKGVMDDMDMPQLRGLGKASVQQRGETWIASGQEYRSTTYGHLNLYWRDDLVLAGQSVNANNWPLYGAIGRETRKQGGVAIYAHGGYAQAIYADFARKNVDAVELLAVRRLPRHRAGRLVSHPQHRLSVPLRRGERLSRLPEAGRLPDLCASGGARPISPAGSGRGRGAELRHERADAVARGGRRAARAGPSARTGKGPHRVRVRVRAASEVAPIQAVQIVVNGRVVHEQSVPAGKRTGAWIEVEQRHELARSSWIAARAFSKAASGAPDAEAHTNPVYVYLDGKAPYDRDSLDRLVARIDEQIAVHRKRKFDEKARVLDDFQKSRDVLLRIRREGGLPAGGVPDAWIDDNAAAIDASRRTIPDPELERFLQPLPAVAPEEALKTFETVDGFRMELVAAEPMVQSPIAAAFDADGNLYVAEMRDYPFKPRPGKTPLGCVRLLRDTDGDGRFDQSHVFADGLLWAAGIAPWKGGVFVTAPPDIWYLKDTDGDGRADVRRKVYTGFGTQNQQAMVNNLTWGLDHWIYGAASGNGGTIRPGDDPTAPGVSVEHSDFRFDPETGAFELVSGNDQFGNTFDDWGNRFTCDESQPLSQAVLPRRELARNPYLAIPSAVHNIAGGSVPIFRISPVEAWRQIRSSRRVAHSVRSPARPASATTSSTPARA